MFTFLEQVLGVALAGAAVGWYVRRHRSNSTKTLTAFVDLDQVNSKPLDNLGCNIYHYTILLLF